MSKLTRKRLRRGGAAVLAVSAAVGSIADPGVPAGRADASAKATPTWQVADPGNGDPWAIGFGSGADFPQFSALDPKSGYLRLVCDTTWGTSIVVTPSFWSGHVLTQGMPIVATHKIDGDRLVIDAIGSRNGLKATLKITISPPAGGKITAEVEGKCEGPVTLDARPGEAFKPVMLSSMRVAACAPDTGSRSWDARSILIDGKPPLGFNDTATGSEFFLNVSPKVTATRFGFLGGKSGWQEGLPGPTVEIALDGPLQVAGYRTWTSNPNDDNLGLWAATDSVLASWHYTVTASRPAD